jgi:hypothetical protein
MWKGEKALPLFYSKNGGRCCSPSSPLPLFKIACNRQILLTIIYHEQTIFYHGKKHFFSLKTFVVSASATTLHMPYYCLII